jgi:hypothetical protein
MMHVFITVFLVWCNVLMHICVCVCVCLFVSVCIRYASRRDCDPFLSFEESTIKRRRPSDQALRVPQS